MASLFTRILDGEIPGRFVWSDPRCVSFLTIEPLQPGHVLVVPREEVDQWVDLDPALAAHLFAVAAIIGRAQREEFGAARIGLMIEGYAVPHAHLHVWPSAGPEDFAPGSARHDVPPEELDGAAERLRSRLRSDGHGEHVPGV